MNTFTNGPWHHRVHRVVTATFWRTFYHDGKISPELPFTLSTFTSKVVVYSPAERADTLPLFLHYPFMYSVMFFWILFESNFWGRPSSSYYLRTCKIIDAYKRMYRIYLYCIWCVAMSSWGEMSAQRLISDTGGFCLSSSQGQQFFSKSAKSVHLQYLHFVLKMYA